MADEHRGNEKPAKPEPRRRLLDIEFPSKLSWGVIVGVLAMVAQIAASVVSLATLLDMPAVYLFAILIAAALSLVLSIGLFLYRRRAQERHFLIAELRHTEDELFRSIDAQVLDLLVEVGVQR